MRKFLKTALLTLLFGLTMSINVFAAGFTQDAAGIHYMNGDGTFVASSWVEVANIWFLFDANGICVNPTGALAPDDTDSLYQIVTSYTPFVTADAALLSQCLANGTVISVEDQYFITPEASTIMRNATIAAANNAQPEAVQQPSAPSVPQPTAPQYVWLSATGSKYHSINNCGNMNPSKARQVTLDQAISLNKGKCPNCW